jgi:uncharacterized SAM-binding protein YcdF (DUF218 family)
LLHSDGSALLMIYGVSKIFWWFIQPGTLLLILCVAGAVSVCWRPRQCVGRVVLIAGVAGLVACAWLPLGTWLLRPLENRFPPPLRLPSHVDGFILLGGAIELRDSLARGTPVLNLRAGRMTAFVALARRYPVARLVFSGGNPDPFAKGLTEAEVARTFFLSMGLDPWRMVFESNSRNTRENALYSRQLVKPAPHQVWILVTSAADMPRAIGCFRAVGWQVIPFPVDYHAAPTGAGRAPGLAAGLEEVGWAAHEWIGLLYYRWRGWTPQLFPSP